MEELNSGTLSFCSAASGRDMSRLIKWNSVISMKKIQKFIQVSIAATLLGLIGACSNVPNRAPVVDRTENVNKEVVKSVAAPGKSASQPVLDMRASYVVRKGDTLYRIALDHGQSYSDLVAWNSLKNPNDIKVDQVLRVASPDLSSSAGVQTASVNSVPAVEVRNLSSLNPSTNKVSPKGDKHPYSEANLLEMQKADTAATSVSAIAIKPESSNSKALERTTPQTGTEQDAIDWIWPTDGKVVGNFDDAKNKGLDISGKLGQDVFAAGAGKVMYEGSGIRGYGNLVIIKHSNNLLSAYAHNKVNVVKEGQTINKGQKIAEMGNSDSEAVKLHFEIRQQGKPVDPSRFLPVR